MGGTSTKNARLYITGTATAMTDEACTEVSGTVFRITDAAKRILDGDTTIVVEVNTVAEDPANYTIDYNFGTITFTSSQTGQTVTITGAYLPFYEAGKITGLQINGSWTQVDVTEMKDSVKSQIPGQLNVEASAESMDIGDDVYDGGSSTLLNDFLTNKNVVYSLRGLGESSGDPEQRLRAFISDHSWEAANDDALRASWAWTANKQGDAQIFSQSTI